MDSESKISSAEQRAARRDLWETARAAYDRPRQSQSEAMRDARRSVWEQAKAAGIQNDETPPPVPTGKETGLNDDPRIARLEGIVRDLAGRLDDLEDDYPESEIGNSVGGGGDYAFKLSATENMDGNGDPYDPPRFTVNVLGGTAQTLGGTPYVYDDEELSDVEEGWHIYVVYENLEPAPSFTEYGEWRPGIKASSETDMADYTAPHDLVFEIGRISKEYYRNVRQDHKGNIVMPAISNVVDIQTQLP